MRDIAPADRLVTLPEGLPKYTLGWGAIKWASMYLRHPDGPRAGQRWEYVESQVRFILWWYALDRETGRWLYDHGVRRLSKGAGKSPSGGALSLTEFCAPVRLKCFNENEPGGCVGMPVPMPLVQIAATSESQPLALDTPVPVPGGWSDIGSLQSGDQVFGSAGEPVSVTDVTPVFYDERCYRVTFDDGEQIIASAAHGWTLERASLHDRRHAVVTVSTEDMAATFRGRAGGSRYRMPCVELQMPDIDMPVDPYLVGLWLGDGDTKDSSIACDIRLKDELEVIIKPLLMPYEEICWHSGPGNQGRLRIKRQRRVCRWGHDWVSNAKANGNGWPQCGECLRQRGKPKMQEPLLTLRERLRGIGVLGNKHIPQAYLRASASQRLALLQGLIDSDGSVNATRGRATFTNMNRRLIDDTAELLTTLGYKWFTEQTKTGAWRLLFTPWGDRPVARLSAKRERQRNGPMARWRYVKNVEAVPTVPVRCITTSGADHLFIVGKRGTLTHNTANTMRVIRAMTAKGSRLVRDYDIDPGKTVMYRPGGGQLEVITSSAAAAEGALPTFCVMDETEHWKPSNGGPDLAQVLARNLAKTGSRGIETANAWQPGVSSVAETTYDAWVAEQEGRTRGGARTLYDARIAPPDTDLADDESLRAGIAHAYGDCWWVDQEVIRNSLLDPRTPVDVGRRFYLNQPTASVDAWVTPQQWSALADPEQVIADGDDIVAFFDGSRASDATALVACHVETGYVFCMDVWEPDPADPDSQVPVAQVDAAVERMFDRWNVRAFFADVKEWESFTKVEWPKRYAEQLMVWAVPGGKEPQAVAWDMRTHVYDFTMAAEHCAQEIEEKAFRHDGDSRVARHVNNARRYPNRWGISVTKESRTSAKKIDAAVCVIGARMARRLLLASPEWEKRGQRQRSGKVWGFS